MTPKIEDSKIAFLFLTRDNVNHPKLWEYYFKGNKRKINIYCHPKNPEKVTITWQKKNIISTLVETGWGYITNAYYQLLNEAYKNTKNVKFIVISESCVPIVPFNDMYNRVIKDKNESFIKFMELKKNSYDFNERIKTQENYEQYNFCKHYARFCLCRCHVKKILEKHSDFVNFFNKMHVADEFFLSLLEPYNKTNTSNCKITNQEITFDNWSFTNNEVQKINNKIRTIYETYERINDKRLKKTMKKALHISKHKNNKNKKKLTIKDITKIVLLSNSDIEKIKQLKQQKETIAKNPKTYFDISEKDLDEALATNAFFMRKIDTSTNTSIIKKKL